MGNEINENHKPYMYIYDKEKIHQTAKLDILFKSSPVEAIVLNEISCVIFCKT